VREGNKVRKVATAEAMIRVLVNKAGQGDAAALKAMLDILDKTGCTNSITDEEREKHALKLPRAFSQEEMDLLISPAREKDRQRYRKMAEYEPDDRGGPVRDGSGTQPIPATLKSGDDLFAQGRLDEAFAVYRGHLVTCRAQLAKDGTYKPAQDEVIRAAARIGLLAEELLMEGAFRRAVECADEAIAGLTDSSWVRHIDPTQAVTGLAMPPADDPTWIRVIRAQGLMFMGRVDEARAFFRRFDSNKRTALTSWETAILRDFARLRHCRHSHPLMNEIETRFAAAGWTTDVANSKLFPPETSNIDSMLLVRSGDINSADQLTAQDKLDEALQVYRRIVDKCKTRLAKDPGNSQCREDLQIATDRIALMARRFLEAGRFGMALECAEETIDLVPDHLALETIRAQAMMFFDRVDDARAIFLQYRGRTIGSKLWENAVLDDFTAHRAAGRTRPLMDEIEELFAQAVVISGASDGKSLSPVGTAVPAALLDADDIPSGDILAKHGMLDEALVVYQRRLGICDKKTAHGRINLQAIEDRYNALERISGLALGFVLKQEFEKARITADHAISVSPNSIWANIRCAHALMFLGQAEEARTIYLQQRRTKVDPEQYGENIILKDFAAIREAGLTNALMDEIERQFAPSG
jgi:tetratricopeptide (TPR) repeat protein